MASTEISIKQLPTANSIEAGNFIIIQTENSTLTLRQARGLHQFLARQYRR